MPRHEAYSALRLRWSRWAQMAGAKWCGKSSSLVMSVRAVPGQQGWCCESCDVRLLGWQCRCSVPCVACLSQPEPGTAKTRYAKTSIIRLADMHSVRALVVDDVAENRKVLARMLAMVGCSVTLARSAEEAILRIEQETPDIVFIDIAAGFVVAFLAVFAAVRLSAPAASPHRSLSAIGSTAPAR